MHVFNFAKHCRYYGLTEAAAAILLCIVHNLVPFETLNVQFATTMFRNPDQI